MRCDAEGAPTRTALQARRCTFLAKFVFGSCALCLSVLGSPKTVMFVPVSHAVCMACAGALCARCQLNHASRTSLAAQTTFWENNRGQAVLCSQPTNRHGLKGPPACDCLVCMTFAMLAAALA